LLTETIHDTGDALRLVQSAMAESERHPEGQSSILLHLLDILSRPDNLGAICKDLVDNARYAEMAYLHNNGFHVLYVTDPDLGFQTRLHVWTPRTEATVEHPHRHRMSFASKVLAGELSSTLFSVHDADSAEERAEKLLPEDHLYNEALVNAPAHSNFDNPDVALESRRRVILREILSTRYVAGQSYFFAASGIHKVDTPATLTTPIITLTVWEIPFQDSIAYEPIGSLAQGEKKRLAVKRLSKDTHRDLINLIVSTLSL
jgi:hypothetical protein